MFVMFIQVGTHQPTPDYDEVAAILRRRGHTIWVGTPNESSELIFHDGERVAAAVDMPPLVQHKTSRESISRQISNVRDNWQFKSRLQKLIRQKKPDLVQVNQAKMPFMWLFPLGLHVKTRFLLDWRQIAERRFSGKLAGIRRQLHLQKRRIPSRYIYSHACFLHPAGAERVLGKEWAKWGTVIPMGVSPQFLDIESSQMNKDLTSGPVQFIYIGSLSRVRRLERVLDAAKQIQADDLSDRDLSITFIGPDKSGGYYSAYAEKLDLKGMINIKPPVPYEEIPGLLAMSDVALATIPDTPLDWRYHPTLKVMEYRAIGIPIIATDFEPNRAVVEDGVNGLLVANSSDSLAIAMRRYVVDREFLEQSIIKAQEMREGLLWEDVARKYERLYHQLTSNGKS